MIWGIVDVLVVIFLVKLLWEGMKRARRLLPVIVLFYLVIFQAMAEQPKAEEDPWGDKDYCPFGDAVIVSRTDPHLSFFIDCILYDRKREVWDTWTDSEDKMSRKHQVWPIDDYKAFVMDGELIIHADDVVIRRTSRDVSDKELMVILDDITKKIKGGGK